MMGMKYSINGHEYTEKDFDVTSAITTQVGYKIIQSLRNEPATLDIVAKKLKIDRRLVAYHLVELINYGLINGEWRITKMPVGKQRGKTKKFFYLNEHTLERCERLLVDISESLT